MGDNENHNTIDEQKSQIRRRYAANQDLSKVKVIPARPELKLMDNHNRKRVVVYCRVSTDGISQTTSFELQKNYYLKMVRQRPQWKLVGLYADEGVTATSTVHRDGFNKMIEDAEAGEFDIIITKNLSRFSRNLMDCMENIKRLRLLPQPVGVYFETESLFTLDKNVDFTLQVLSLVAQEESHKKSEAMNASYQQRFSQGHYVKAPTLGFDKDENGDLAINEEESETVKLIFKMYMAGKTPEYIAEQLMALGRKTKTFKTKDGRIKPGQCKWSRSSVLRVLSNEKVIGDVRAQKTWTPDYLTHKCRKNKRDLPMYYAPDQHKGFINREDWGVAQRLIAANRGGWKMGVPHLKVFPDGALRGCVQSVPKWKGFCSEDYNRAALRSLGISDQQLDEYQKTIDDNSKPKESDAIPMEELDKFQHQYSIDSDDYLLFPDVSEEDIGKLEEKNDNSPDISFATLIEDVKRQMNKSTKKEEGYDLSRFEVIRSQFFSSPGNPQLIMDSRGMDFSRLCSERLKDTDQINLIYNPIDKLLIVKKAEEKDSPHNLNWMKEKDGNKCMRRCSCPGITRSIYENMDWFFEFKYRIYGSIVSLDGEDVIVFYLDEPVMMISTKLKKTKAKVTNEMQSFEDEYSSGQSVAFKTGSGLENTRSTAIYYNQGEDIKPSVTITLASLGERRFDPLLIRDMIRQGKAPQEGWGYLSGKARFKRSWVLLYPKSWSGGLGDDLSKIEEKLIRLRSNKGKTTSMPYGWTVGLDLPSENDIENQIKRLSC